MIDFVLYFSHKNKIINMKTQRVIVAVIIVIIIGITAGIMVWVFAKNSQVPVQQTTVARPTPTDETALLKTYTNIKYGFEFKYPSEWGDVIEQLVAKNTTNLPNSILFSKFVTTNEIGNISSASKIIEFGIWYNQTTKKPLTIDDFGGATKKEIFVDGKRSIEYTSSQDGSGVVVPLTDQAILIFEGDLTDIRKVLPTVKIFTPNP